MGDLILTVHSALQLGLALGLLASDSLRFDNLPQNPPPHCLRLVQRVLRAPGGILPLCRLLLLARLVALGDVAAINLLAPFLRVLVLDGVKGPLRLSPQTMLRGFAFVRELDPSASRLYLVQLTADLVRDGLVQRAVTVAADPLEIGNVPEGVFEESGHATGACGRSAAEPDLKDVLKEATEHANVAESVVVERDGVAFDGPKGSE